MGKGSLRTKGKEADGTGPSSATGKDNIIGKTLLKKRRGCAGRRKKPFHRGEKLGGKKWSVSREKKKVLTGLKTQRRSRRKKTYRGRHAKEKKPMKRKKKEGEKEKPKERGGSKTAAELQFKWGKEKKKASVRR